VTAPDEASPLAPVIDLVCARIGHRVAAQRLPGIESGVRRLMAREGMESASQLIERACVEPGLFDDLVSEFAVTETYFFRDLAQLEAIRRVVLPGLAGRRRPDELRIWSAGCATGEEAYSIAILLEQEGLAGRGKVLATDLSRRALATARKGVYPDRSFRGGRADVAPLYFERNGDRWRAVERLRRRIRFEQHNLTAEPPPGPFDLIVCRNVLIYFADAEIRRIAARLHDCLAPGGWLVLGPSDPPLWQLAPYEVVLTDGGVFCRRRDDKPSAPRRQTESARPPARISAAAARRRRSAEPASCEAPAAGAAVDAADMVERARLLANSKDGADAERALAEAVRASPASAGLQHLHSAILHERGRLDAAARAARRAIFLDPTLLVAHLMLAAIMQRAGRSAEALRALKRAEALGAAAAPEGVPPLSNGETAAQLLEAARRQIAYIGAESPGGA
jgi:chemotaxis protein methyltransferase CheR